MAMPPCGTFSYAAVLPERGGDLAFSCDAPLTGERPAPFGTRYVDNRLVGYAPRLDVTDAGPAPDAGPARAGLTRAALTLTAADRANAQVRVARLYIARGLLDGGRSGDVLHVVRDRRAGLGVSLRRDGALLFAVGAISATPLGPGMRAFTAQPSERGEHREWPFCLKIDGRLSNLPGGPPVAAPYDAVLVHGAFGGLPGTPECAALWHVNACDGESAIASAKLLDGRDGLTMTDW